MTISRWKRGVDVPDHVNALLLQTRLGIAADLWHLSAEHAEPEQPAAVFDAPRIALLPETVAPTKPPKPPWPPHGEGPTRRPGEGFRAAVERREAWRVKWQAAWLADWHRAHPGV